MNRTTREASIGSDVLVISSIGLVGREHDWLHKILTDWRREEFTTSGPEVDLCDELLSYLYDATHGRLSLSAT